MGDKPGPSSRSIYFNPSKSQSEARCKQAKAGTVDEYRAKKNIYYTAGNRSLSVKDFDISLLYIILRNICNISPEHKNGWGKPPQKGDYCISACIERIRLLKNSILAHSGGKVEDTEFQKHWDELKDAIIAIENTFIGGTMFQRGVDDMLTSNLSPKEAEKYDSDIRRLNDSEERSIKTNDKNDAKKPRSSANVLVAAIDFGTAYSGHAFSPKGFTNDPHRITAHKWSASLLSRKTPTNALFNKDEALVAFGYEAEQEFTKLSEEDQHKEFYFFQKFKMQLYDQGESEEKKKLTETSLIYDINGKEMSAMYVFSAAIKYMHDHLLTEVENQDIKIQEEEIHWVLTVPAIWDDSAKKFMRDAAEKAGIRRESLDIALEPEAASMFCKNMPVLQLTNKEFEVFSQGNRYLILDAGGGTVDVAIHEVLDGGCIKEIHKATGGAWGGTYVNDKFIEILEDVLGKNEFEKFKREDLASYIELCKSLELSKRGISTTSSNVALSIPPQLANALKISKSKYAADMECKGDKLKLKESLIKMWFSDVCNSIVKHVRNLVDTYNIEIILMVGGFSESLFLQETMKEAFPNKCIVVPNEASLAVLKGAVLFGHNPSTIVSRVAKYTYGVNTLIPVGDVQSISDKTRIQTICGVSYETNVFHKHVTKGDTLKIGEAQHERAYSPVYKEQDSIRFFIYSSPREDPKYVDEAGCNYLGYITVDIPKITECLDRRVLVRFIFGGTEIKVEGENEKTKKVTTYTITSSGNPEEDKKFFGMPIPC